MSEGEHEHGGRLPASAVAARTMTDEEIRRLRNVFATLAEDSRIRIVLHLLSAAEESSVTEVAEAVGLSISGVSHQLRELRHLGWVKKRRSGRNVLYSIADRRIQHLLGLGSALAKHRH